MSLRDVFIMKEGVEGQHWTSDGNRYSIQKMYDYAKSVTDPEQIPVSALAHSFEHTELDEEKWSDAFNSRCNAADLKYPILVARDKNGKLWISDGNHRYGKALMKNIEMIYGYVIDEKDIPEKALEPKVGSSKNNSHKKKAS